MVDSIRDTARRARREYSNRSVRSTITEGTCLVTKNLWLELLLQQRSVSQSELKVIAAEEGRILHMEEEEPLSIEFPTRPKLREEFEPYPKEYAPERQFVCEPNASLNSD